jgi:hypothetical protein
MTDDLITVTGRTMQLIRNEIINECAAVIGNMRQSETGLFDAKHSGQRGCDRSDALYDAYQAVRALAITSPDRGGK